MNHGNARAAQTEARDAVGRPSELPRPLHLFIGAFSVSNTECFRKKKYTTWIQIQSFVFLQTNLHLIQDNYLISLNFQLRH